MSGIVKDVIQKAKGGIDYSKYGLDYNPFPSAGVAPDTVNIDTLRRYLGKYMCEKVREDEVRELAKRLVQTGYVEHSPGHTWIWGDWRVGKSTLLMKVYLELRDNLQDVIVIYSPKPRHGIVRSTLYYFLRGYEPEFYEELSSRILVRLVTENPVVLKDKWVDEWKETMEDLKTKSTEEGKRSLLNRIKDSTLDVFSLVQDEDAVDTNRLRSMATARFAKERMTQQVISIFTNAELKADERYAAILDLEKEKNLERLSDNLVALLQACLYGGYKHVFVFLDDVEDVMRLWTRTKQRTELDILSSFLDRMFNDMSMVGTMHAELFTMFSAGPLQRFVGRAAADPLNFALVRINPLELPDLFDTVTYLLSKATKGTPPYPLYPFKEEVLKDLHTRLGGKIGMILPSLYHLLRMGAESGEYPEIDLSFYEKCQGELSTELSEGQS